MSKRRMTAGVPTACAVTLLLAASGCSTGPHGVATASAPTTSTVAGQPTTAGHTSTTMAPPAPATVASTGPPAPSAGPQSCPTIPAVTGGTTAPVDFEGNGAPYDTFRVYQVGTVWHARAEIFNLGPVSDVVVSGSGPLMAAIGGATVNNDATQEAWIKVGSGASTKIISFFVYRQCRLQRVLLNNAPAVFPIGYSVTHADGLHCFGFNIGIEVFSTTSSNGVTYTGSSKIYTLDLSNSLSPKLVLGSTSPQSESNPPGGAAFDGIHTFTCDDLGPTIP